MCISLHSLLALFFFFFFIQLIKAAMKTYLLKTNGNSFYCEYPMTILFSPASNIPHAPCQHGCCLADHTCGARPRCHVTLCEQLLPLPTEMCSFLSFSSCKSFLSVPLLSSTEVPLSTLPTMRLGKDKWCMEALWAHGSLVASLSLVPQEGTGQSEPQAMGVWICLMQAWEEGEGLAGDRASYASDIGQEIHHF